MNIKRYEIYVNLSRTSRRIIEYLSTQDNNSCTMSIPVLTEKLGINMACYPNVTKALKTLEGLGLVTLDKKRIKTIKLNPLFDLQLDKIAKLKEDNDPVVIELLNRMY